MVECCICLNRLNGDIFKLSCGHELHLKCYLSLVYSNEMSIFFKCPLCRELNHNNLYNTKYHNLRYIIDVDRCVCKTKKNQRCKKKAIILNNGMCNIHNELLLPKGKYGLLCDYILWLFETPGNFRTKYLMIDVAKNICIKYDVNSIHEISHHTYHFWHANDRLSLLLNKNKLYEFIGIDMPVDNIIEMLELSKKKMKLII